MSIEASRIGGGPIFCDPSEIGDLRQGRAENSNENYLLLEPSNVILHLHNAVELVKLFFSGE